MTLFTPNRKKYMRRLLLGLFVLFTAMAQNVPWLPYIFTARALPLVPLTVAIAALDQPIPGLLYGALAGLLWDFCFPAAPWHGIYLATVAFVCAVLMRYLINRNVLTVGLLSAAATLGCQLIHLAYDYKALPGASMLRAFLRTLLPGLAYTLALTPLCYLAARAIVRRTSRRQHKVLAKEEAAIKTKEPAL